MNTNEMDLESRINARCMEMVHKLDELEFDMRIEAAETRDELEAKLSELRHIIKEAWSTAGQGSTSRWGSSSITGSPNPHPNYEVSTKGRQS